MADHTDRIGKYALGQVLGVGTVGTVYRAVDTETGTAAALKILLPQVSADAEIAARFEREITILEKLSHPNVVACLASGRHGDRLYYVMELVGGGTLKDVLRRKHVLDWEDVVEIGWQLCSALQHLHNNGVVHRDLKPGNIYLTSGGEVKLGDFGIALDTAAAGLTEQGKTVGTWLYMPPEQIRGKTLDAKADLYSLGCVLYECLTGRPPFTGSNFADIFEQHLRQTAAPIGRLCPSVPGGVGDAVAELLAKEPADRPLNARAVQGRLAEALLAEEDRRAAKDERRREKQARHETARRARTAPDIWAIDAPRRTLKGLLNDAGEPPRSSVRWTTLAVIAAVTAAVVAVGGLVTRGGV